MSALTLRRATPDDARLLWTWRNDDATRRSAFHPEPVPWGAHVAWFQHRLTDPFCHHFIIMDLDRPVAQVRFDLSSEGDAEVDVTVAPASRGRGVGSEALSLASAEALRAQGVRRILAHVKPENGASLSAFEAAGYRRVGAVEFRGHQAIRFVREPPP